MPRQKRQRQLLQLERFSLLPPYPRALSAYPIRQRLLRCWGQLLGSDALERTNVKKAGG